MVEYPIYNPLDYRNLAENVADRLMKQDPHPLPPSKPFNGAGVYALFYTGDFEPYAPIRSPDATQPIYVGKAMPPGGRKGSILGPMEQLQDDGPYLYNRLVEHASSIKAVENLRIEDFRCRFLRVTPVWITMAELILIQRYSPIWNGPLDGFGLHDPGAGRSPVVSWWDAMHPGRPQKLKWKANIRFDRSAQEAIERLRAKMVDPSLPVSGNEESTE